MLTELEKPTLIKMGFSNSVFSIIIKLHIWIYPNAGKTITLKQNRRLVAASLTEISPRPMLMGAPHDALRASNAGVSLRVPVVVANRVPLCF